MQTAPTSSPARIQNTTGGEPDAALAQAYAHCASIVRSRARNFYYGLRLTPEPRRSAIYSVYAWMRRADDVTDSGDSPCARRAALAQMRETAERMIMDEDLGDAEGDPVWKAFRASYLAYGIEPEDLRCMLDTLDRDIEHDVSAGVCAGASPEPMFESREGLRTYCYGVASTVGLVCIAIWGLRDGASIEEARGLAIRRGIAFQLTNVLRDFAQDYTDGRVYLPRDLFERYGISSGEVYRWSAAEPCRELVLEVAGWARNEYLASAPLDGMVLPESRPSLSAMTRIYSGLLAIIEHHPGRVSGGPRIRLRSLRKAGIAARALIERRIPALHR